ncbi:general odorant-binding protein 72-like isoform X2 [Belonocnema kinseyi]|nr:general odorant-binding protein 72-like isoform X2 [Belonocnema kinseyi]XP_033210137.1 general odorant-binding protein 72-like isoform X2 [Belonocnema kinseyi]
MDLNALKKSIKGFKPGCIKASGISEELADAVTRAELSPDPNLMCYLKCVLQKMKGIKNDKISIDMLIAQTNALVIESIATPMIVGINTCAHTTEQEDICKAAYDYSKCFLDYNSTLCMFP